MHPLVYLFKTSRGLGLQCGLGSSYFSFLTTNACCIITCASYILYKICMPIDSVTLNYEVYLRSKEPKFRQPSEFLIIPSIRVEPPHAKTPQYTK